MFRIATADVLFTVLRPACRFRAQLVNLFELIDICAHPRSADAPPLRSHSLLTRSLARGVMAVPILSSASSSRSSPRNKQRRAKVASSSRSFGKPFYSRHFQKAEETRSGAHYDVMARR